MKLLFVADPISYLNAAGDSSLAMAETAMDRGHEVYWTHRDGVYFVPNETHVQASSVIREPSWREENPQRLPLTNFDAVLIRKDPPFDENYVRLCWMLSFHENTIWMLNPPSKLIRYHEKLVQIEALMQGFLKSDDIIPTFIGATAEARAYVERENTSEVIVKPFLGYGGREILKLSRERFLALSEKEISFQFVQPFMPEVVEGGDRRVFLLNGEVIGSFLRMPKSGGFVSNLAQGGTAKKGAISDHEMSVLNRLGKFLKAEGIYLAGADVIGERISEVNITSPTGMRQLQILEGDSRGNLIVDFIEKSVGSRKGTPG